MENKSSEDVVEGVETEKKKLSDSGKQGARSGGGEGCEEQGVEVERVVRSKEWSWRGL